jgi:hypothetical protein
MQTYVKFTDSEIAAGWRIENGHLVRPLNEATKKAIAEFDKIMEEAKRSHAAEMARRAWEAA